MDTWLIVLLIAVAAPVVVIWALARAAALRGPEAPPRGRPVEALVTEVIADDRPEEERAHPDAPTDAGIPAPPGGAADHPWGPDAPGTGEPGPRPPAGGGDTPARPPGA